MTKPNWRIGSDMGTGELSAGDQGTDLDTRRRRAVYRAGHRGTKEMDHLLGRYARAHLGSMSEGELSRFEQFLAMPDPELQGWLMAPDMPQDTDFSDIVAAIRTFHGL